MGDVVVVDTGGEEAAAVEEVEEQLEEQQEQLEEVQEQLEETQEAAEQAAAAAEVAASAATVAAIESAEVAERMSDEECERIAESLHSRMGPIVEEPLADVVPVEEDSQQQEEHDEPPVQKSFLYDKRF